MCGGGGFFGAILDADMLMTQSAISLVPFPPRTLGMAVQGKVPNSHKNPYTYHMMVACFHVYIVRGMKKTSVYGV